MNKKKLLTYLLPLAGGAAAAGLRYAAVQRAVDPGTGIPVSPGWIGASYAAMAAAGALALIYRLLQGKKQAKNPRSARSLPVKGLTAAASLLLVLAAGAAFFSLAGQGSSPMTMAQAALSLACGAAVFAAFKAEGSQSEAVGLLTLAPVFYSAFQLLSFYRANNANPLIYSFAAELFAYIAVMFAFYAASAVHFGKPRPRLQLFCCLTGLFLLTAVLLSDNLLPFFTKGYVHLSTADLLSMAAFLALLCAQLWPLEPAPAQEGEPVPDSPTTPAD